MYNYRFSCFCPFCQKSTLYYRFDNQTYETTIYENTQKYTTIITVHAKDPDAGLNGEVVYGFTTKTQRAYGDIFNIDESTGEIFVVETLDYEDGAVYILDVTAKDKSADPLPTIAKVTVHVKVRENFYKAMYEIINNFSLTEKY